MSNTNRFSTALMIAVISMVGLAFGFSLLNCGRIGSISPYEKCERYKSGSDKRSKCFDKYYKQRKSACVASHALLLFGDEENKSLGTSIIVGTLILDGVIFGVYRLFGKQKEQVEPHPKKEEKKEELS